MMGRMLHGVVIELSRRAMSRISQKFSGISTINALTDAEHPCQILSDLFTIEESGRSLERSPVAFIGDGDCNVARSWMWAAVRCGFQLRVATPEKYRPPPELAKDVAAMWSSLKIRWKQPAARCPLHRRLGEHGKGGESALRMAQLQKYQINRELLSVAPHAGLHCLPAYRGKWKTSSRNMPTRFFARQRIVSIPKRRSFQSSAEASNPG